MRERARAQVRASSNRRGEEPDGESEQHKAAKGIDRYVYRTDHWKITQLITEGSGDDLIGRPIGRWPRGRDDHDNHQPVIISDGFAAIEKWFCRTAA